MDSPIEQSTQTLPRYGLAQRLVHWLMAAMVLCTLPIGMTLGLLGFDATVETFGIDATNALFIAHKTLGVLLFGLILVRIALRVTHGKPPYAVPLPRPQRVASEVVHGLLYVLLLMMPIIGWLATASGGFPINFFHTELPGFVGRDDELSALLFQWHRALGLALLALVIGHVAAALYHWRVRRDGVMQRMKIDVF